MFFTEKHKEFEDEVIKEKERNTELLREITREKKENQEFKEKNHVLCEEKEVFIKRIKGLEEENRDLLAVLSEKNREIQGNREKFEEIVKKFQEELKYFLEEIQRIKEENMEKKCTCNKDFQRL